MKPIKKIALLHDLCGVGKAALTNMMPILGIMGVEACPVPTMLLSTHTGGYGKPATARPGNDYLISCAHHFREEGVSFDAIFIGYLGSAQTVSACEAFLDHFPDVPVILDPIMGDNGTYYGNFDDSYKEAVKRLVRRADILLPNLTEACLLTGTDYGRIVLKQKLAGRKEAASVSPPDLVQQLCSRLVEEMKPEGSVILTSAPAPEGKKSVVVYENGTAEAFVFNACGGHFHGTGDVFDGVFAAAFLKGCSLKECVHLAHDFTVECIEMSSRYVYPEREGLLLELCLPKLLNV